MPLKTVNAKVVRRPLALFAAVVVLLSVPLGCQRAQVAQGQPANAKPVAELKAAPETARDALAGRFRHFAPLIGTGPKIEKDHPNALVYRRGKIVVINVPGNVDLTESLEPLSDPGVPAAPATPRPTLERQYDFGLYEELERSHPELLAKTADEVGTVILVRSDLDYVGNYKVAGTNQPTQSKAYTHSLTIQLVDAVWGIGSGREVLQLDPPDRTPGGDRVFDDFSSEHRKQVADLVASLRERPMPDGPDSHERVIKVGELELGFVQAEARTLLGVNIEHAKLERLPVSDPAKLFAMPDLYIRTNAEPVPGGEYLIIDLWHRFGRTPEPDVTQSFASLADAAGQPLPPLDSVQMRENGLLVRECFDGPWRLIFKAPPADCPYVVLMLDTRPFGGVTVEKMHIPRSEIRRPIAGPQVKLPGPGES